MLSKYYLVIETICYSNCIVRDSHVFNNHVIFISHRAQCMCCTMKSGEAIYVHPNDCFKINVLSLNFLLIHLPNDLFNHCEDAVSEKVLLVTACLLSSYHVVAELSKLNSYSYNCQFVAPTTLPSDAKRFYSIDLQESKHFIFNASLGS